MGDRHRHGWQWWELITRVDETRPTTIRALASDMAGRSQPTRQNWNRLGYGNNVVPEVRVQIQ